jgi:hypothetical protein
MKDNGDETEVRWQPPTALFWCPRCKAAHHETPHRSLAAAERRRDVPDLTIPRSSKASAHGRAR